MTTTLPNEEQIINSLVDIQSAIVGQCQCEDAPDFHDEDCPSFVEIRLRVTDDDWEILYGPVDYDTDHRGVIAASTLGRNDDEDVLADIAEQLLTDIDMELAQIEDSWA